MRKIKPKSSEKEGREMKALFVKKDGKVWEFRSVKAAREVIKKNPDFYNTIGNDGKKVRVFKEKPMPK
jgi:hypothetical protein